MPTEQCKTAESRSLRQGGMNMDSKSNDRKKKTRPGYKTGAGIAIGLAVGAGIGLALDNMAIGVAVWLSIGVAIGSALEQKQERPDDKR
jgi:hypothetical protein